MTINERVSMLLCHHHTTHDLKETTAFRGALGNSKQFRSDVSAKRASVLLVRIFVEAQIAYCIDEV